MTDELGHSATLTEHRATEYLANERTFLAWIRTSLVIMSLGFVVARFSTWLHELEPGLAAGVHAHYSGLSMPVGIGVMAVGGAISLLAAWRYYGVNRAIKNGTYGVDLGLTTLLTVATTLLCIALTACLLLTIEQAGP